MQHPLGSWAVLDIETTGADRAYDEVIDVGFLQFEGTKLVGRYQSMVRYEGELSQFIQKLTGLTPEMLKRAPRRDEVEHEVDALAAHHILAHNADFEQGFLSSWFERGPDFPSFEDSLPALGLVFPQLSRLNLEGFIKGLGVRETELHRGYEDAEDLLKVMLVVGCFLEHTQEKTRLDALVQKHGLTTWWPMQLLLLNRADRQEIEEQIEFCSEDHLDQAMNFFRPKTELADEEPCEHLDADFSGEAIKQIWSDEQRLQEKMPGYRLRQSQLELSLRVGQAFKNDVHALIQAPTGTGKTLGYLLPSSLFALQTKSQVLVATGTKTLQHQAMKKDVPALRRLLGLSDSELKVRPLVGSGNHVCELLYRESQKEEEESPLFQESLSFEQRWTRAYLEQVFYWNANHEATQTLTRGDLSYVLKLKFSELARIEREIAVDFRSCTGQRCPFRSDCGYLRGLREARDAQIVVGNHSLMFSWPRSFPRPEYIVVDEAHKLEGEITESCTLRVTGEMLSTLSKQLQQGQGLGPLFYLLSQFEESDGEATPTIQYLRQEALSIHHRLEDHLRGLEEKVELYFKQRPRYTSQFWNEMPIPGKDSRDPLGLALYHHFESIRYILTEFNQLLLPYRGRYDVKNLEEDQQIIALTRFENFAGHAEDIEIVFDSVLGTTEKPGPSEDMACSLKYREGEGMAIEAAPINVGRLLHDGLLLTAASCVMTSATLGNATGDQGVRGIEWATGYSYVEPKRRFKSGLYLPAQFDYAKRTRVFLCDDTPVLHAPEFVPLIVERLRDFIRKIDGRCLLLFSARQRFEIARELLLKEFEGEIPLFIQGMGNDVVDEFKAHGRGILLGMESFGEGIDVPGDALQFVFIDKIPDLRMDLVIQKRRDFYEANLGNEFTDYYLSHRTRSLQQKLGRLLRTETDYGAVVIVDSRIRSWKGRSMETFRKLMEPYNLERTKLEDALEQSYQFLSHLSRDQ
jgi:ATP-dependent DNA helicase DinG